MAALHLLYKREYAINDFVKIMIPSVGEVLDCEDDYYTMVSMLTAMPVDMMVQLDDLGVDFMSIDSYELFLILFGSLKKMDTALIFGDLDLRPFEPAINTQNQTVILRSSETGAVIDRGIHGKIASVLRRIHGLKRNNRRPANKEAREFMLQRARDKMRRKNRRVEDSNLESLIVAMVNTEQFHYGFEGTRELSIYQFNESVRQVIKVVRRICLYVPALY